MQEPSTFLGIEIGGTKLQLSVSDDAGKIIQSIRFTSNVAAGAQGIQEQLKQGIEQLQKEHDFKAVGVGFGGPVDWRTGIIQVSHQVKGWQHFNLKEWLHQLTGKPVMVDNDANVAALAEATQGGGRSFNYVFYMTIGSGIGGGMIINRKIYHGRIPGEVEIGHIRLDKNGDTLESKCSGWAVNKKVRDSIDKHPDSLLAQLAINHEAPEAALLKPALEKGDPAAHQIINEVADDIAFALSHVVHLFHPEIIILGGGLALLQDYLALPVSNQIPRYIMDAFLPAPLVQVASLGEQVVPIGALELAKTAVLEQEK